MNAPRRCPLCGGDPLGPDFPYATMWQGQQFQYLRCSDCGCTFVDPVPSSGQLAAMYSREAYHDVHYALVDPTGDYARSATLLRRHAGGRGALLDLGCGNGSFMLAAQQAGFRPEGIEFTASAIESAHQKSGLPVSDLETVLASGRRFDIVHAGDVLEHLPDPASTLGQLFGSLQPGGLLFAEGPLQSNPSLVYLVSKTVKRLRRALGRDRPGRTAPTHLTLTTRTAQRRFFTARLGLRELMFEVYETGWPYRLTGVRFRSVQALIRHLIGLAAVAVSALVPVRPRVLGNRFAAIYEVPLLRSRP